MYDKMFSFEGFLGFRKSFCGIDGCFWNPCFISEYGHWHFDKFDFKFSNSLTSRYYVLQWLVLNKMECLVYNSLGDWIIKGGITLCGKWEKDFSLLLFGSSVFCVSHARFSSNSLWF